MRPFGDRIALDLLFAAAGDVLGWQADLAWLARGGVDVPAMLERYGNHLRSVHLKDTAPPGTKDEEGWADLGHGTLPWADWMAHLAGVQFIVLEHDAPADPARFLLRSAANALPLTGDLV